MTTDRKKNLAFGIRLAGTLISTALFVWIISRQKWELVLDKATGIAPWALLLAVVFYLLGYLFNTLRWCCLLWAQGVKISLWQAYRLTWTGNFNSNFLPSTIGGDGFRMLAVHRYTGSKSISIGSVVLDRIINMSSMVCLLPAPLMIFGSTLLSLLKQVGAPGVPAGTAFLPGGPRAWLQKTFEKYFPKIVSALRLWSSKPWSFLIAFLVAWPSNLLPIAATWLLAQQLGMQVSYWQVLGVQTVSYFLTVLPISVNGYGLREAIFTTLYAALGVPLEQASTLALITRFLMIISTLPGALWLSSSVSENLNLEDGAQDR